MADDDLKARIVAELAGYLQEKAAAFDGENARKVINALDAWVKGDATDEGVVAAYLKASARFGMVTVESGGRNLTGTLRKTEEWALEQLSKKVGLEIDELSEEGLARAIGRRAGIALHTLHDADILAGDLIEAAADRAALHMGWRLERAIRSANDFMDLLERRARLEIERRIPGLVLHDLTDRDRTQADFLRYAADRVKAKTGIPFRDLSDPEKIKNDMVNWADAEVRRRLGVEGTACGGGLKMTKKAIRNRLAQRRFHAAHGTVQRYLSVKGG